MDRYTAELEQAYALPDDLAAQMETEPEKVLPKLAAQLHMAVEHAVYARLSATVPQMMHVLSTQQEAERGAKDAFYSRWPDLKEYEPQVLQIGQMFRSANPNATPQEALERVGQMVYVALGKTVPGAPAGTPPATPPASGRPPASPPQVPSTPARPGFTPAMPGGGGAAPPPKDANPFTQIAEELLEDDARG